MKTAHAILLCAGLLLSPAGALAQPSADAPLDSSLSDARRRFQRGVDLYREGSFDAALAEFGKAYQLAPNYRILYNLAQVQTERHDYIAALKLMEQYLREGSKEIAPERREQVEQEMRALRARIAELTVSANIDGAELLVDGAPAGELPLKRPLLVNSGVRRLQLRKEGYSASARSLTIAGGEVVHVEFELRPEPGQAASAVPSASGTAADASATAALPEADSPSRAPLWISLGATALFTGGAITFAVLTSGAEDDLDKELDRYPANPSSIDDARSDLKRNALLTDVFTAAAVVSGGLSIYFAVSKPSSNSDSVSESARSRVRVSPAGAGLRLDAVF